MGNGMLLRCSNFAPLHLFPEQTPPRRKTPSTKRTRPASTRRTGRTRRGREREMRTGLLTPSTRRPGRRSTQDSGGEKRTAYYSSLGWTIVQYWWYSMLIVVWTVVLLGIATAQCMFTTLIARKMHSVFLKKGFSRHTHTSVHVVRTFRTPKHEVVVYTGIVSRDWRMEKEDIYFLRLQLKGLFVHGSYSKDNVRDWKTFSFFSA